MPTVLMPADLAPNAPALTAVPSTGQPPRIIIITAGDHKVMPMLQGLIRSIEAFPERRTVEIGCLDVGQTDADRAWLTDHDVALAIPTTHLGVPDSRLKPYERAFVARPFLREYFPGRDIYVWIDSDVWLQGWWVIEDFCRGAQATGLAVAHERERAYAFQGWLYGWFAKHFVLGYGVIDGAWLLSRAHLNAGLFAMRADSPHWQLWVDTYQAAWERTGTFNPHDQFSINRLVHGGVFARPKEPATLLPPRYNWICARGQPMWNDDLEAFCEPYPPYRLIGAVHLAGPGKTTCYTIRRTGGGSFKAFLTQGVRPPPDARPLTPPL